MRTQYERQHPCALCRWENECAVNDWCLVDMRNNKCPNNTRKYRKERKKEEKYL